MERPDLLAATLRAERPTLVYRSRAPKLVVDRVSGCVGAPVTIDARDPQPDLLRLIERARGSRIILLLPAELPGIVEDALELLRDTPMIAVTPAHRISPALSLSFDYRLTEEQVL